MFSVLVRWLRWLFQEEPPPRPAARRAGGDGAGARRGEAGRAEDESDPAEWA